MFFGEGEKDPTDAGMHPVVQGFDPLKSLATVTPQHCVSSLSLDLTSHLSFHTY